MSACDQVVTRRAFSGRNAKKPQASDLRLLYLTLCDPDGTRTRGLRRDRAAR
jgi:hypothetical protein